MVFAYRVYKHVYGHVYGLWFSVLYLPFLNPDTTYDTASLRTQSVTAREDGGSHSRGPAIGAGSDGRRR